MSVRAPVGDVNITEKRCCIGRGLAGIKAKNINREFLFQHLQERKKWIERISAGSTYDSINSSQVKSLNIRVPPLPEQRKIASVLYTVDQAIQKTEAIIDQTERVKQGVMQRLFTEGYFEHEEFEELWIGPLQTTIPVEWEVKEMSSVVDKVAEIDHHMPDKQQEGVPFIAAGDIANGPEINLEAVERISEEEYERLSDKFDAERGDILYTRFGTIGVAKKIDFDPKFVASYSVALIKPSNGIKSDYLEHFLNYPLSRKEAQNRTRGSANKNLNLGEIKKLSLILPPVEEQEKIAAALNQVDNKLKKEGEQKRRLQRLKRGLMQGLLTGAVRTKDRDIDVVDAVREVEV